MEFKKRKCELSIFNLLNFIFDIENIISYEYERIREFYFLSYWDINYKSVLK